MANVLADPKVRPEVIIPDFSKSDPVRTFNLADVFFVYGGKFKQRYFRKAGDDYYPLPATWDVMNQKWRPYTHIQKPTSQECDGCHSAGPQTQYVQGHNPYFLGQSEQINQATYLGGGRDFGPYANLAHLYSRNLTPDSSGRPIGGDSFEKFRHTIRTGHDPDQLHPNLCDAGAGNAPRPGHVHCV